MTAPATQPMFDPERACFGKKSYPSEQTAEAIANHVWLERWVSLRAYACDVCNGWHLTKQGAPQRYKPGWHEPLRPARERREWNEKRRRRDRGRK